MKTLTVLIFMIVSLTIKGQATAEDMVVFLGNKVIENLSGSYILGEPEKTNGMYLMQISCPERTDFDNVSWAWEIGVTLRYSDIIILRQWTFSDNTYTLGFRIEDMAESVCMIMYYPEHQLIRIGLNYDK